MRRRPYTAIGIARIACARCGRPSSQQWNICADGNQYRGVCTPCDLAINAIVLRFMRIKNWRLKMQQYIRTLSQKSLCASFVLLASIARAQVPCTLPPPTTVSLNPTHVYADLFGLPQVDAFDVAYFDGTTLVQGPSTVPKSAWTQVAGTCHKAALPLQVPTTGAFAARVRSRQGTTVGAWSAPSHLFGTSQASPPPPAPSGLTIGPAELLYTNAQIPFESIDGTFATLKKDATTTYFFVKQWLTQLKFSGPLDKPFQTLVWSKPQDAAWNMRGVSGQPWLMNVYQVDLSGTLLGFVHREVIGTPGTTYTYAIGLGYSTTNGDSWTYLGDIVTSPHNTWNVAGAPYLVVGPYFYVYFNDFPDAYTSPYPWGPPTPQRKYMAVARALVADVLQAALNGTVTPWKKFNNGTWTQNGIGGIGSNIIPDWNTTYTNWQLTYDMHSDAAYNTALGKYLLTVQTHNQGELLLYLSTDGVTWNSRTVVDTTTPDSMQPYSTIVGTTGASADSHEVGSEFYILYPRKRVSANAGDYNHDDYYRRKVTVDGSVPPPPPPPPPPPSGTTYLSDLPWVSSTNGWGPAERDKNVGDLKAGDGGPLKLKGVTYAKGVGTHAVSSIRVALGGSYTSFLSDVGIDDAAGGGSVIFTVWADGVKIYDSGLVVKATATRAVNVSVVGKAELRLDVSDGGNGYVSDWGDWAGARLTGGGVPCVYTVTPTSVAGVLSAGATAGVTVTTTPTCSWTASSAVAWLTTTASGMGTGPASVTVLANSSVTPRTGVVTVAGQPVTVTQLGALAVCDATRVPTVTGVTLAPQTLAVGEEAVVTVLARSPEGRIITRMTVDFVEADGVPASGPTGNLMAVRSFAFWPTQAGTYTAVVEVEDAMGCTTRVPVGAPLVVTP